MELKIVVRHPVFELDRKASHRRFPIPNGHRPFLADIAERQIEQLE